MHHRPPLIALAVLAACQTPGPGHVSNDIVELYDLALPAGMLEFEYDRDGNLLEAEADIDPRDLPRVVLAAAENAYPGIRVTGAEREVQEGEGVWEVKFVHEGRAMELVIVRHARPIREEREDDDGPADPPLSDHGLRQARRVAEFLHPEGIHHVVASSMTRAHQTAIPLARLLGVDIELRDDLREVDQHSSRYIPQEEMTPDDPMVQEWMADPLAVFDGDYDGFRERVVAGFDAVIAANRGRTVAVFCHGMVMAVYLQTLWSLADPFHNQPGYTGIHRVTASSTGLRTVRSVNETGHVRDLLG